MPVDSQFFVDANTESLSGSHSEEKASLQTWTQLTQDENTDSFTFLPF